MRVKKKNVKKEPTAKELRALYDMVRSYCRRERRDADVGSPRMVQDWCQICEAVGIKSGMELAHPILAKNKSAS